MKIHGRMPEEKELMSFSKKINTFQEQYKKLCRRNYNPFIGCSENCLNGLCLYRFNVNPLLEDGRLDRFFRKAITNKKGKELWRSLKEASETAGRRVISDNVDTQAKRRVSLCYAIQKSYTIPYHDWRSFLQERIVTKLQDIFNSKDKD